MTSATITSSQPKRNSRNNSQHKTLDTIGQKNSQNPVQCPKKTDPNSSQISYDLQSESSDFSKPSIMEQTVEQNLQTSENKTSRNLSSIKLHSTLTIHYGIKLKRDPACLQKNEIKFFDKEQAKTAGNNKLKDLILDHLDEISLEEILEIYQMRGTEPQQQFFFK